MRAVFEKAKTIIDGEETFLCISIPHRDAQKFIGEMVAGKKYTVEIKQFRERRNLDQNALAWELIGKLSGAIGVPPETIYREAIRDVGDNYEVMPVRNEAADRWKAIWTSKGLGWVCEEIGPSKIPGYTNFRCFYGSSVYDKAQFARLLDNLIEDCKAAGVEILTRAELALLKEEWK